MTRADYIVDPGESKEFVYVGNLIPNEVLIQNLDNRQQANFIMRGLGEDREPGWALYGVLDAGETASLLVVWPTWARIINDGPSPIIIGGMGIFAEGSDEARSAGHE